MEMLREGIGLRGYAQSNPLQAYTEEGFNIFDQMQQNIDARIATFLLKAEVFLVNCIRSLEFQL